MKKGFAPIVFLVVGLIIASAILAGTFLYTKSNQNKPALSTNQITKSPTTQLPKISPSQTPTLATQLQKPEIIDNKNGWSTFKSHTGNYKIDFPTGWKIPEAAISEKKHLNISVGLNSNSYLNNLTHSASFNNNSIKYAADDFPVYQADYTVFGVGLLKVDDLKKEDLYNPESNILIKGVRGGGGGSGTYDKPQLTTIGGYKAIMQKSTPIQETCEENCYPNITVLYYIYLDKNISEQNLLVFYLYYFETNKNINKVLNDFQKMATSFKFIN